MKVINLFGAPSSGKSSAMLGIAYHLKMAGLSIEKTDEYFKELILEQTQKGDFGGQLSILSEQNRRLARLLGKNDFAVTDCPLPLITYYTPNDYIESFKSFSLDLFRQYDNVNYFLQRNHEFETEKRDHDEHQSNQIHLELIEFLSLHQIPFKMIQTGPNLVQEIIEDLCNQSIITQTHLEKSRNPQVRQTKKIR